MAKKISTAAARGKGRGRASLAYLDRAQLAGADAYFRRAKGETLDQVLARCPHESGDRREAWRKGAAAERARLDLANKNWPAAQGDRPFLALRERKL